MQYCRIICLDNNNSVKFTSSREDNSTTNNSMVTKIANAQLHTCMYTNIMYKFQSSMCKTVGEKLRKKLCPRTDGRIDRRTDRQTDSHGDSSIPPFTSLWGYKYSLPQLERWVIDLRSIGYFLIVSTLFCQRAAIFHVQSVACNNY